MTLQMRQPLAAAHLCDLAEIHALRRAIGERIERDIAILDALDGDPDLEDDGTAEPILGHPEAMWGMGYANAGSGDDREQDAGDEREIDLDMDEGDGAGKGLTADDEPTLGFPIDANGYDPEREPSVHVACRDGENEDGHDAEAVNEDGREDSFGDGVEHGIADQGATQDARDVDGVADFPGGDRYGADDDRGLRIENLPYEWATL